MKKYTKDEIKKKKKKEKKRERHTLNFQSRDSLRSYDGPLHCPSGIFLAEGSPAVPSLKCR